MENFFKRIAFEKATIGFEDQEVVLNCNFDFPLEKNCRVVFQSDREKFFFFHAMSQVSGFQKGHYWMNDADVTDMSFEEFLPYRLRIGFSFSTRGLIHNRTLRQNLELPLRYHKLMPEPEIKEWMNICVDYFNLRDDLDRRPAEVSTSSQKAALVLRGFIHKPEVIFLDTPELMLSTKLQANLLQLIDDHRKYHNLRHLFFATHDEDLSDCLVDHNIILRKKNLHLVEAKKLKRIAL